LIHEEVSWCIGSDSSRESSVVRFIVVVVRVVRVFDTVDLIFERATSLIERFTGRGSCPRVEVIGSGVLRFEEPEKEIVSWNVFENEEQPIVRFIGLQRKMYVSL
jgi:hypothetical protein